jgi:hypothetical protein
MNEITERINVEILPNFWASKEGTQLLQDHELFPSGSLAPVNHSAMEMSAGELSMDSEDNLLEGASDENDEEQDSFLVFQDDHFASPSPTVPPPALDAGPAFPSSSQYARKPSIIMSGVRSLKNMASSLGSVQEKAVSASSSTVSSPNHDDAVHMLDHPASQLPERILSTRKDSTTSGPRPPAEGAPHGGGGDGPVDALYDVVLEIFDLRERNNWFRRQATTLIIQQIMGATIERWAALSYALSLLFLCSSAFENAE